MGGPGSPVLAARSMGPGEGKTPGDGEQSPRSLHRPCLSFPRRGQGWAAPGGMHPCVPVTGSPLPGREGCVPLPAPTPALPLSSPQEKRKRQTEIENKRRQLEDDRRQLQHLKVRTPLGPPGCVCTGDPPAAMPAGP